MEEGEELHSTLSAFVLQKRIPSAFYQGIGSVSDVELGYFDLKKNDYDRRLFKGEFELTVASGNVSVENGVPFVHTHVVLADKDYKTISGHFFKGTVTATIEIFLFPLDIALLRRPDKKFNFKGLELPHHFVP